VHSPFVQVRYQSIPPQALRLLTSGPTIFQITTRRVVRQSKTRPLLAATQLPKRESLRSAVTCISYDQWAAAALFAHVSLVLQLIYQNADFVDRFHAFATQRVIA
jgi:hypothetical protein